MAWAEDLVLDLRVALRGWRGTPWVGLAAIATLALGIGANTAMFSVVSGVLIRPLPFPHADGLTALSVSSPSNSRLPPNYVTIGDLAAWRQHAGSLQRVATYSVFSQNLQRVTVPEQVATVRADRAFFATLGVDAMLGRVFGDDDPPNLVVASFGFWRRQLGGDRLAIGRQLTLDGEPYTLVGVMPEGFEFPYRTSPTDLWTIWAPSGSPSARLDAAIGRMKSGVTIDAARSELTTLSARLAPDRHANVTRLSDLVAGPLRTPLLVLLGAVGMVLLTACANVANLLLARAAARRQEVAIRVALGAGRARLIRQCLAESLLLAFAGGLIGLAIGKWGTILVLHLANDQIPRAWEIGFDWRVFTFLLAVCALTTLGLGLVPALDTVRAEVRGSLAAGGRTTAANARLRDALVVVEVALAFVLLAGAGLLLRTFLALQQTPSGFNAADVLTLHVVVAGAEESRALEQRVARIPGVRAVGFISLLPLQHSNWNGRFVVTGRPVEGSAEFRYVTPGYFDAMGIPIGRGRPLSDRDTADAPKVVLVNEALARQYFPNEDPVGRELTDRGTIVGVVGDVRQSTLERPAAPELYYPVAQNFAQLRSVGSSMVVRSGVPAESLVGAIRSAMREVSPNQATFRVETMDAVVQDSLRTHALYLWLLGLFATIGTMLAAVGIYGVIAHVVTLRTREFGIRMALGADAGRVVRLVAGRGGALVALGLAIGCVAALALSRFLSSVLYEVTAVDPATYCAMGLLLAAVALAACVAPARRAARVDPAVALRSE